MKLRSPAAPHHGVKHPSKGRCGRAHIEEPDCRKWRRSEARCTRKKIECKQLDEKKTKPRYGGIIRHPDHLYEKKVVKRKGAVHGEL